MSDNELMDFSFDTRRQPDPKLIESIKDTGLIIL